MSLTQRPVEPAEVVAGPGAPATVREAYPPFEGSNIGVWLGFKHFMYLMEEAAIQHVRERWMGPRALWEQHGLGLEIVDSSIRILTALHLDQLTRVEVRPREGSDEYELATILEARNGSQWMPVASGSMKLLFRRSPEQPGALPEDLLPYVRDEIERNLVSPAPIPRGGIGPAARPLLPPGATVRSFVWRRRIPYFYCHFMDRLQHSGYLRLAEEVVDLFLAERGMSIRTMLERRSWIPVVAEAGVEILREARLEEEICTVFTVRHVYKGRLYSADLDWYVARGAEWVQTARGRIVHGYARIQPPGVMRLVPLDGPVLAALTGERR
jgi:acyl-CoA thioesterase FadM